MWNFLRRDEGSFNETFCSDMVDNTETFMETQGAEELTSINVEKKKAKRDKKEKIPVVVLAEKSKKRKIAEEEEEEEEEAVSATEFENIETVTETGKEDLTKEEKKKRKKDKKVKREVESSERVKVSRTLRFDTFIVIY